MKVGGIYTTNSGYIDIIVKITNEKIYTYYINDVTNTNQMVEKKLKSMLQQNISHFSYVNKKFNLDKYNGYLGKISEESFKLLLNNLNNLQKEKEF